MVEKIYSLVFSPFVILLEVYQLQSVVSLPETSVGRVQINK